MDLYEYQKLALRTESIIDEVKADKNELNHILNAFIIVGDMLDAYKKKCYYHNSKKYDEQFQEYARKLLFFAESLNRHHQEPNEEVLPIDPRVFHGILGILTESSELAMQLEGGINGKAIDAVNIQEELGDGAGGSNSWYSAILHDALGLDPQETMQKNIDKLAKRFGDKFSDYKANNRDLEAERKILEK